MKKVCLLAFIALPLLAQNVYTVSQTVALSGTAAVVTVQQPSTGALVVRGISAFIDSTTASCGFVIERNGATTVASSTAVTPAPANPSQEPVATTTGWTASNVDTGTVISRGTVMAGGGIIVNLNQIMMHGNGTWQNFTLRTSSCTTTVDIILTYSEANN